MARANAIANQLYVVNLNAAQPAALGRSLIVDPEGLVRLQAGEGEELLTDVLDLDAVTRVREYGTGGVSRMWEQIIRTGPGIELPMYGGDGGSVRPPQARGIGSATRGQRGEEAAMASVEGVNGPIDADELGLTLIHEHFFSGDEAVTAQWPHARDRDQEWTLAMESADAVKSHDVKTVVEPTAMMLGREVSVLQQARLRDRPADRRLHRDLHLRPPADVPHHARRRLHRGPLCPRRRTGDAGHGCQGGLHQVRRRRAGDHRERREAAPRRRARLAADGRTDHGPLAPGL